MAWTRYSRATIDSENPRALGTCDRCGFIYNHNGLRWQYDWRGPRMQNLRVLVCSGCTDTPQQNGQRVIIIPADPLPIMNPRQDPHMFMGQSSSPDPYQNGSPNVLATEDGNPFVTQTSSSPLISEIGITPTPTSSGYTEAST